MPPEVRERQRRIFGRPITDPGYVVAAYHAETAYVDDCIGALLSRLAKLRLADETAVVVTSDHGDIMSMPRPALGRLWCFCHVGLNEDCLRIPLIMAGPGIAEATRPGHRLQLVDLLPTLLDLAGIPQRTELDGRSFSAVLRGGQVETRNELFFSENTYQKQRAVLAWPWKHMRMEAHYDSMAPRCLYNLERDPLETVNLSDAEPEVATRMEKLLNEHVSRTTRGAPDPLMIQDVTSAI
jgi:arylsulfatase A-like enzyme